jgi:cyclopropane-fatty-acyl-phospholipid synthase
MTTTPVQPGVSVADPRPTVVEPKPFPTKPVLPAGAGFVERWFCAALARADISINGGRAFDITVHNPRLYRRVVLGGLESLGDAYVDGWWDCPALDLFFERCYRADLPDRFSRHPTVVARYLKERLLNLQTRPRARRDVRRHYDLGNDLFRHMLDPRMAYSCGYWRSAATLADAQEAKLDLICRKIGLRPGMSVLDIGCGWGSFVKFAAECYGARATGVTLSPEQARFAQDSCRGLPVEIRVQDYRDTPGTFDRVVSVGMFEHVGPKNYRRFMECALARLAPRGLFLLHTIGCRDSFPNTASPTPAGSSDASFPAR